MGLYKKKEIEAAIERVSSAISHHPTNRVYYSNRILMYLNQKSYDLALSDCQIIRELDPHSTYIKGHYLRGLTLKHLGKYKNAASAFQTVIKLNPQFKKASDRLDECLKELKEETDIIEQRRSSQHELLKKQFAAAQSDESKVDAPSESVKEDEPPKDDEKEETAQTVDAAPDEPVVVESDPKTEDTVKAESAAVGDEEDTKKSE